MKKDRSFTSFICIVLVSLMVINILPLWAMAKSENELTKSTNDESVTPVVVCEDVTKRGEFEKHFICSDGTVKAVVYNVPVHYMSENGTWEDIDNSLVYDNLNESYSNKLNPSFDVSFLKDGAVRIKDVSWKTTVLSENKKINSRIESIIPEVQSKKVINGADASLNETFELPTLSSSLKYSSKRYSNYDISYVLFQGSVKENLTMYSKEASSIKLELYTYSKEYIINNDDTISFVDSDGEIQFTVYPPIVFDADYSSCDKIGIDVVKNTEGYSIEYSIDEKWLSDEERSFPVSFQRIVSSYYASSNYINMVGYQRTGSGSYSVSSSIFGVGHNYSSGTHTFYSSFLSIKRYPYVNTDLNLVTDISVVLNKKDAQGLTVIKTYKLTSDDFEKGALKTSVLDSGFSGRSTFKNYTFAYSADKFELKLDPNDYDYNNPDSSYGYVLTSTERTSTTSKSYAVFYSSNDNSILKMPSITVTYSAINLDGRFGFLKNNGYCIKREEDDSVGLIPKDGSSYFDLLPSIWKFVKYNNYYRIVLFTDNTICLKVNSLNDLCVGTVTGDPYSFDEMWDICTMMDNGVPKLWISSVKNNLNICHESPGNISFKTPSSEASTALWEAAFLENDLMNKIGTLKNESLSRYLSYENTSLEISTRPCVMAANCSWKFVNCSNEFGSCSFLIKFSSKSEDYSSVDEQCLYYDADSNSLKLSDLPAGGSIPSNYIWNISVPEVDVAFGDVWQYRISISNSALNTGNYLKMNSDGELSFGSMDENAVWVSSGFQKFGFPIDDNRVETRSSKWGYRNYTNVNEGLHYGVDLGVDADVYAMAYGIVIYENHNSNGYGNRVVIYHPDSGYCTTYQHLKSMDVSVGDIVIKGQKIGHSGKTGSDKYRIHLHFEVWNYFDFEGRKSVNGNTVSWRVENDDRKHAINPFEKYNDTDFRMFNTVYYENRGHLVNTINGDTIYTYINPNPVFLETDEENIYDRKFVYNEDFCYSYDNDSFYTASDLSNSKIGPYANWRGRYTETQLNTLKDLLEKMGLTIV